MSKGAETRQSILEHAGRLASQLGVEGVTIGRLAVDLALSKSGLFAHFKSKEALQLQLLEFVRLRFVQTVIEPAFTRPAGEERVRAIFDHWLDWPERSALPGGCFFVAASFELDDRPGPVRDRLAKLQGEWFDTLARAAQSAIKRGQFRADLDPRLFAHEMYGLMLSGHLSTRLLNDPDARERTCRAFAGLMARSRANSGDEAERNQP
ncbi:MAG: TetR/AcrR family transcriptional regulator [Gemmatimonadales bacterium]|nr:TetR/AcrR family transcriptional regulator [Gemmatimonadales bacterium]